MLHVVTASLNNLPHLLNLWKGLQEVTVPLRWIIVDNGSSADMLGEARKTFDFPAVEILANEVNLGAARAWNTGIERALDNGAEQLLICGNDTVPMPGTIDRLVDLLNNGLVFVTGTGVPYETETVHVPLSLVHEPLIAAPDYSFFMFKPMVVVETMARWDMGIEMRRFAEASKQSTPTWRPVMNPWEWGKFDSQYFPAYFEDSDHHYRARNAGLVFLRDPGALFRHDCSLTIRTHAQIGAQNRALTFARNAERFRSKWGGLPHDVKCSDGTWIQQARPLNVTDVQWREMTAGREITEINREAAIEQAGQVYGSYGIQVKPS